MEYDPPWEDLEPRFYCLPPTVVTEGQAEAAAKAIAEKMNLKRRAGGTWESTNRGVYDKDGKLMYHCPYSVDVWGINTDSDTVDDFISEWFKAHPANIGHPSD